MQLQSMFLPKIEPHKVSQGLSETYQSHIAGYLNDDF